MLIKSIFHKLKHSPFGEIISRGKAVYGIFDRRGQHIILALYASHTFTLFLKTLKLFGFASLLIVLGKPKMVLQNHYVETAHKLSGLDQEPFLILISGVLVGIIILQQTMKVGCKLLDIRLTQGLVWRCNIAMYNHYMALPYEALVKMGPTLAISKNIRMVGGVVTTEISKNKTLFGVLLNGAVLLAALFITAALAASITLVLTLLFFLVFFVRYKTKMRLLGKRNYKKNIQSMRTLREGSASATELVAMGKKDEFVNKVQKIMVSLQKNRIQTYISVELPKLLLHVTSILALFTVATIAILNSASHALPTLVIFGAAAFRMRGLLENLFSMLMKQERSRYAYQTIIKDMKDSKKTLDKEKKLPRRSPAPIWVQDAVTFESVSYSYPKTRTPVIDNLSVSLPTNKVIVLSGKSGVGKTTFVRLLSGLLIPQKGKILIDGKSLHQDEVFKRAWQRSFGITFQKPFFMNSTLAMNIAFESEKKKINYERIREVIELVQLDDLVAELPNGVDSELSEDAETLSGGQRQRIAIARSLYRGVPILVLDEATNAIDLTTERKIISALTKANRDKLVVIISHRMEIMKFSDMIVFMKKDKSIVHGTAEQLLGQDAEFKSMIDSATAKAS